MITFSRSHGISDCRSKGFACVPQSQGLVTALFLARPVRVPALFLARPTVPAKVNGGADDVDAWGLLPHALPAGYEEKSGTLFHIDTLYGRDRDEEGISLRMGKFYKALPAIYRLR